MSTVVFVHAHPDDEALLTSGTMAALAAHGHRVVLVVATAGEAGLAAGALRSGLGERRLAELHASADALGVSRVEVLGYADSGLADDPTPASPPGRLPRLADAPIPAVAARVAELLLQERADIVNGYDANGGDGQIVHHRQPHPHAAPRGRATPPRAGPHSVPHPPVPPTAMPSPTRPRCPRNWADQRAWPSWPPRPAPAGWD